MVKGPFKKWDRVDTFCALLVDLGCHKSDFPDPLNRTYLNVLDRKKMASSIHDRLFHQVSDVKETTGKISIVGVGQVGMAAAFSIMVQVWGFTSA